MSLKCTGQVRLRRAMAWVCLLAWLQAAGLAPMLVALPAAVENAHEVSVSTVSDCIIVVLSHRPVAAAVSEHRHGLASRILCWFGTGFRNMRVAQLAGGARLLPTPDIPHSGLCTPHWGGGVPRPTDTEERIRARRKPRPTVCVSSATGPVPRPPVD